MNATTSITTNEDQAMRRIVYFAYGIACYLMFFGVFVYAIGFISNLGVPNSLDAQPTMSPAAAVAVNLLLLGIFAMLTLFAVLT